MAIRRAGTGWVALLALAAMGSQVALGAGPSQAALRAAPLTLQVEYGGQAFTATLTPSSVTTFEWSATGGPVTSVATTTTGAKLAATLAAGPTATFGTPSATLPAVKVGSSPASKQLAGFGGALTDSAAFVINNSPNKARILEDLFGSPPTGAGLNIIRLPIGATDLIANPDPSRTCSWQQNSCYAPSPKCHDTLGPVAPADCFWWYPTNVPASRMIGVRNATSETNPCAYVKPTGRTMWSRAAGEYGTGEFANTIPVLKCAEQLDPNLQIVAAPWSAPGPMKVSKNFVGTGNCRIGKGFLNPADLVPYAAYLANVVKDYEAAGVPISVLSMQNEPYQCDITYPTMLMGPANEARFSVDLSAALDAEHLATTPRILGWDHNWFVYDAPNTKCAASNQPEELLQLANDVSLIGYHSYCGNSSVQAKLEGDPAFQDPEHQIWVTESSGFETPRDNQAQDLVAEVKHDLIDPLRNGAEASLYWNVALDQDCGPQFGSGRSCSSPTIRYSGCTDCRPMITVDNANGTVHLNEDFDVWAQFSKFLDPGARLLTSTRTGTVDTVAFENPDQTIVLVALDTAS